MTKKIYLFLVLFVLLGILYAVNIFNLNKASKMLIETPVNLSFVVIAPEKSECSDCFDVQKIIKNISSVKNIKVSVKKISDLDNFTVGMIKRYEIKNLPAILVSGDIDDKRILGAWVFFGGKKYKDKIVIQNLLPYYDIDKKKIKGIVDLTLIKDSKCTNCFPEKEYISMLKRRNMFFGKITTYDRFSAKGSSIIKKYKIKEIPTFVLSKNASDYPGFSKSWTAVGTKEEDGSFVLRGVQKISNGLKFEKI